MTLLRPRDLLSLLQAFPQLRESLSKQLVLASDESEEEPLHLRSQSVHALLHLTAEDGDVDLMRYLLSIDESISDLPNRYGRTPLSIAAGAGQMSMVILLLDRKNGAKADSEYVAGNMPLM
jgi:ankyrin repeat protein